ncbi:hypothetical protein BSKO_13282 [Bryopsis sp. KO-2023]|nr:hypothetical protein BSKO_13282 [Bryopsis sp. KO-2023]
MADVLTDRSVELMKDDKNDSARDRALSRDAHTLWSTAGKAVKTVGIMSAFKTLRNMVGDAFIPPDKLQYVRSLGEGAYATVELANYDCGNGKYLPVAVKRLKPEVFENQADLQCFLDETKLLQKLRHSCVVDFLGMGIVDKEQISKGDVTEEMRNKVYLVQEYMNRGTLKELVLQQMGTVRQRLFTGAQALEWMLDVAKGLRYLHTAKPKVIHRDLKLENILLKEEESGLVVAKLADFGLHALVDGYQKPVPASPDAEASKRMMEVLSRNQSIDVSQTAKQEYVQAAYDLSGRTGSLMYMAPEVLREEEYNESCDIFSLGVIMYEVFQRSIMLVFVSCTGNPNEVEEYAQSVSNGARPCIPECWPERLSLLVKRCWSGVKEKRPTANEVVRELELIKAAGDFGLGDGDFAQGCSCCTVQ